MNPTQIDTVFNDLKGSEGSGESPIELIEKLTNMTIYVIQKLSDMDVSITEELISSIQILNALTNDLTKLTVSNITLEDEVNHIEIARLIVENVNNIQYGQLQNLTIWLNQYEVDTPESFGNLSYYRKI